MRTNYWISLLALTACGVDVPNGDDGSLEVSTEDTKADGVRGNWVVNSNKSDAQLGQAVVAADMNGDGLLDLVIGAPGPDKVYIYLASEDGLPTRPDATITGPFLFGWDIVRIPRDGGDCFASTSSREPYVSVYCGLATTPAWRSTGVVGEPTPDNDWNMAAGDYNGDGDTDLVISESGGKGRVWAINGGGASVLRRTVAWKIEGEREFGRLGDSLAMADFDDDGFADLVVGAPADAAGDDDGFVRLYRGSSTGLGRTAAWTRRGPQAEAHYGKALATSDVNGDGRSDLLVTYETDSRGSVDVYHAAATTFSSAPARTLREAPSSQVGQFAAAIVGGADIDGDGYGDVLVGDPLGKGRVLAYRGGESGLSAQPAWTKVGPATGTDFGKAVAMGDVDGDGKVDIVIGEPLFNAASGGGTAESAGRVHAFAGTHLVLH